MRAKATTLDEMRKSIAAESDDDATRSSSGGVSTNTSQRQVDLSLLRRPILTAVTGFLEAHKAYESGTEEIRKLLANECDLLYECRVCRNIFRSLTNFISHKRVYCRKLFNAAQYFHFQNDKFWNEDVTTIIQAERESEHKGKKVHVDIHNKDLSSIIERLRRKQQNPTDYYTRLNHKLTLDDLTQQQHLVHLDRVPNSDAAMYQSFCPMDNIQAEVQELEKITSKNGTTVLGPDGKMLPPAASSRPQSTLPVICDPSSQHLPSGGLLEKETVVEGSDRSVCSEKMYNCSECSLQFDTEKTLNFHTERRHTPSTYVYPCPCCSETFMQCRTVINHLTSIHKKTLRKARQMRDSIMKRRTRADEVVVKGPSRELARLQLSSGTTQTNGSYSTNNVPKDEHDEAAATRAWMENLEHFDQGPMCSYCGKTFERRAVLSTHMQTCLQKIRQSENASVPLSHTSSSSSTRRSKSAKCDSPVTIVKIKQEPVEPIVSDDSNSGDIPLSALQARITLESKKDEETRSAASSTITVKPEELNVGKRESEAISRRKRKKPLIMLRNASDDISWEIDEPPDVQTNDIISQTEVKEEPVEEALVNDTVKVKKSATKPRKRKSIEVKEELDECEMQERMDQDGEIACRCGKSFIEAEKYKRHIRVFHRRQRRYWCAICTFKGYRKVDAVNHLIQEHGYQGNTNDVCALINVQPTEKTHKSLSDCHTIEIKSVIEAVRQNCDKKSMDISFTESKSKDPIIDESFATTMAFANLTIGSTEVHESSFKNKTLDTTSSSIHSIDLKETSTPEATQFSKKRLKSKDSQCFSLPTSSIVKPKLIDGSLPSPALKRPTRNRVKPVDKDFVYDLTNFLCKEEDLDEYILPELITNKQPTMVDKPKSELVIDNKILNSIGATNNTTSSDNKPLLNSSNQEKREIQEKKETKRDSLRSHAPKPKPAIPRELLQDAAYKMAKQQVALGLAAFHCCPEPPTERSFIPSKMSPQKQKQHIVQRRRTNIHDWPVVKRERKIGSIIKQQQQYQSDIQVQRQYTKRASLPDFTSAQRKTYPPRRNSVVPIPRKMPASLEILNKLNASRAAAGLEALQMADFPLSVQYPSEAEFKRYIEANLKDHRAKMSQVNLNGTTVDDLSDETSAPPKKRITLMQRLEENKIKRLQEQNKNPSSKDRMQQLTASSSTSSTSKVTGESVQSKPKKFSAV